MIRGCLKLFFTGWRLPVSRRSPCCLRKGPSWELHGNDGRVGEIVAAGAKVVSALWPRLIHQRSSHGGCWGSSLRVSARPSQRALPVLGLFRGRYVVKRCTSTAFLIVRLRPYVPVQKPRDTKRGYELWCVGGFACASVWARSGVWAWTARNGTGH